jgi:WD40 repeat protein
MHSLAAQPIVARFRIFVSYSRHDAASADALVNALIARGFEVTIDRRNLEFGVKWQAELAEFIRLSDTVIWLVSEASIHSQWVNWELDEVSKRNKRLVPVMVGDTPRDKLPRQIGEIQILPFEGLFDPVRDLDPLVHVLETDHDWLKESSRLFDRAYEWLAKHRTTALLLRGAALSGAERWKDNRPAKAPAPAPEVLDLILSSRQAATRTHRRWIGGSLLVAIGALILATFAFLQRNQALLSQSRFLSNVANERTEAGDPGTGMLLALEGLPTWPIAIDRPLAIEALRSLYKGTFALRESLLLAGHADDVNDVAFSSNGKRLLSTSDDGTVRVWSPKSSKQLMVISGHEKAVLNAVHQGQRERLLQAAFSPNDKILVTVSALDPAIHVWDAQTGTEIKQLTGHLEGVLGITFDSTGKRLASGSADRTARIWSIADAEMPTIVLRGHQDWVNSVTFSHDNTLVLTASKDRHAKLWELPTGHLRADFIHPDDVLGAEFNSTLDRILTWSRSAVLLWDSHSADLITTLEGHSDDIQSATFSHDGLSIATASKDQRIGIWDARTGDLRKMLDGHTDMVTRTKFSSNDQFLASSSRDGRAIIWDARIGQRRSVLGGHQGPIFDVVFSPDDKFVATASRDRTARLWALEGGPSVRVLRAHTKAINGLDISHDGTQLATASDDNTAAIWEFETGNLITKLEEHKSAVRQVSFDSSGERLVSASDDRTAIIWAISRRKAQVRLIGHDKPVNDASFCASGLFVVTASDDRTAAIWQGIDGQRNTVLRGHTAEVLSARCNARGDRVVTASLDSTARIWDVRSGEELAILTGHDAAVTSAAFSPDGSIIMTSSVDGTARLWSAEDGNIIATFPKYTKPLVHVTMSDNGKFIVTGAVDGTSSVWDGRTFQLEAIYTEHQSNVSANRFRPGTLDVASSSGNGEIHFWKVFDSVSDLVTHARQRVPRCLTSKQRLVNSLDEGQPAWCRQMVKWRGIGPL